jgi:hypothetical protein
MAIERHQPGIVARQIGRQGEVAQPVRVSPAIDALDWNGLRVVDIEWWKRCAGDTFSRHQLEVLIANGERDVPVVLDGDRTPNVAERAGVLEDYILTNAMMTNKPNSAAKPGGAGAAADTTNRTTVAKMYKVENIDDNKLRSLAGKRVEVMGKIDAEPGDLAKRSSPPKDRSIGPDQIELPEFEATSIKEVTGTCPATSSTSR